MTISTLGECKKIKHIMRKRLMKQSVLGEYGEFTVVGLIRTYLRIRSMKLSTVGECAE